MTVLEIVVTILSVLMAVVIIMLVLLTQQLASLYQRIPPTGARITNIGLDVGDHVGDMSAQALNGDQVVLSGDGRRRMLLFVSPSCPLCSKVMPAARALARDYRNGSDACDVTFISAHPDFEENMRYAREHGVPLSQFVASDSVA